MAPGDYRRTNRGGGSTVKRVLLHADAALIVRNACAVRYERQRREDASAMASHIIMDWSQTPRLSPSVAAALPWLEHARQVCDDPQAATALDELILVLGASTEGATP
jgi:hypothetical protein